MTSPATHLTDPQGWQPWMAPVSTGGQAGSRVWGRDLTGEVPSGRKSEPSSESCWAFTFAYGELASDLLTHMNGRVYDYRLGRFLSVDPIISNPLSSQAINPYSYIGNNPLSGTDPTGYQADKKEEKGGTHSEESSILGKIKELKARGLVNSQTSMADVAKKVGVSMETMVGAFSSSFKQLTGGSGAGNAGPSQQTTEAAKVAAPGSRYSNSTMSAIRGMWDAGMRGDDLQRGIAVQEDVERAGPGLAAVADVTVALYPGAGPFGHVGIGVNTTLTEGFYPANGVSQFDTGTGWVRGQVRLDVSVREEASVTLRGTPEQDAKVQAVIDARRSNPGMYVLRSRNCATFVGDALRAGGYNVPETVRPRALFETVRGLPERTP